MGFGPDVLGGERREADGQGSITQPPYLSFRPPVAPVVPLGPIQLAFRGLRTGAAAMVAAALAAHLLGLYCLYELANFGREAWFYEWVGYYDLIASAVGVVAAACMLEGSCRPIVLLSTAMLIVAGMLDFGSDGTAWVGLALIALSVAAGLIWTLPSIDRSTRAERPVTPWVGSMAQAPLTVAREGLCSAAVDAGAAQAHHWTGGRWRLIGTVLLVLAAVAILPSSLLYLELALWYHPSEGYLEIEWDVLPVAIYELASVVMGLIAARYTLRRPLPLLGFLTSAVVAANVFLWWFPPLWGGFFSDYPMATLVCFVLAVPSAVLQLLMMAELERLGPLEAPGAGRVPQVVMGARGPPVRVVRAGTISWKWVALLVLALLLVGPSAGLVVTHEHIVGEVTQVGEDPETGWDYFIVETREYDSYAVYNIFPNSPAYRYSVGDHFDEWVPDACWVRF